MPFLILSTILRNISYTCFLLQYIHVTISSIVNMKYMIVQIVHSTALMYRKLISIQSVLDLEMNCPNSCCCSWRSYCFLVQGRRGSDSNRRSADCKVDLGSGRCIPIKQVQYTVQKQILYDVFNDPLQRISHQEPHDITRARAVASCGVMKCCDLSYWPEEWMWVFLAAIDVPLKCVRWTLAMISHPSVLSPPSGHLAEAQRELT